ncbi:MAG TPA: LacI family transcriptional regulator [Firmicutes bacterium]|nr:LacI family transcriptional regulator [Bacillota bacterium]
MAPLMRERRGIRHGEKGMTHRLGSRQKSVTRRVTLKDVAEQAGVSVCTASLVLSSKDKGRVSEATRKRVRAVARGLNYKPDFIARGLKTRQTCLFALVIQSAAASFFAEVIQGIQDVSEQKGYNMLLYTTNDDIDREARFLRILEERGVDGIIICPNGARNVELLNELYERGTAIVGILNISEKAIYPQISVDNFHGGFVAAEHLIELGHRRIAHLGARGQEFDQGLSRFKGYNEALREHGLEPDDTLVIDTDYSWEKGYAAARKLFAMRNPPTAIFACGDMDAWGAMRAIRELGLSIPHDVSVVGYDNLAITSQMEVPLTTVDQPKYEIGRISMLALLEAMTSGEVKDQVITPTLVVRESTSRPRSLSMVRYAVAETEG